MAITKTTIEEQILAGQTEKAIDSLLVLAKKFDNDLYNSSVMLSGRYKSLARDNQMGIVASDDYNINLNRINMAILHALGSVRTAWSTEDNGSADKKPKESAAKKNILFLAANPITTQQLQLDVEARDISHSLRGAAQRDSFEFKSKWALRPEDLRKALLDENPSIVHFSGHGSSEGRIILVDGNGNQMEMPPKAIGSLFELFSDKIECVILNACYSESQAQEIVKSIPIVIGMNDAVPDNAAIVFATAFYDAIGAGKDYEFAFKLAKLSIEMEGVTGEDIPVLLKKPA